MAEWSIASVLKTEVLTGTGGSNPSLSATKGAINGSFVSNEQYSTIFDARQDVQGLGAGFGTRVD